METRRNVLKGVIGVGVLTGALPNSWVKPVVNSVVLPVHAQTSAIEDPTTGTVSGASSVEHGTAETFTLSPSDDNGISSVAYDVSNGDSGTGNSYSAPTTLDVGSYTITWTITGKKADGSDDTLVLVNHIFEVVCPSGSIWISGVGCQSA